MIAPALAPAPAMAAFADPFAAPAAWSAIASDGVRASLAPAAERGVRLSFDFDHVAGFAGAKRPLAVRFPAEFRLSFRLRGSGAVNDLQLKFADASGKTVWWWRLPNLQPAPDWREVVLRRRDIVFAWGPGGERRLDAAASVELVLARGRDGGTGELEAADFRLEPATTPAPLPPPVASDPRALDGRLDTAWPATPGGPPLTVDFGGLREIGGLVLRWRPGATAHYRVEASDDGRAWRTLRTVTDGDGGDDPVPLPATSARALRVRLLPNSPAAALAEVVIKPPAWSATPNALVLALAGAAPRGAFPRGFSGEQPYWTLVAGPDGAPSGLMGEDGQVEVGKGGFSLEPFVTAGGRAFSWADVRKTPSLERGWLPIPHVRWNGPGFTLDGSLFADAASGRLMARWRLRNTAARARALTLALAVRPFQVNPPAQFLSQVGGVSPISSFRWRGGAWRVTTPPAVDGDAPTVRSVLPVPAPDAARTAPFDRGGLARPSTPTGGRDLDDASGLASGALLYTRRLAPGAVLDVRVAVASGGEARPTDAGAFDRAHAAGWARRLGGVTITAPRARRAVAEAVRTASAHILMSRDGPALRPGTRSYDRSWIRDGTMMSDTLLRLGEDGPVERFADWYAARLFADGKAPCCVDRRGADPTPENDAQGEFIHLLVQTYRYTGDRPRLERAWPKLLAAWRYMNAQSLSERTAANLTPERRARYGLMPPSISHEGYSAEPQASLWDDFWALTGFRDALAAARTLGKPQAPEMALAADRFAADLRAAVVASAARFKIDYVPGAVTLGDWDATSTTIAFDPAGEAAALDPRLLRGTFERQWRRVRARARPGAAWSDYTPYEWRNVSAFVRLGWRDRAAYLFRTYMADRRPPAWNGWAEVVGRDPRAVRFIGDMPHAWVASDFIRAALDLFAYEDLRRRTLVLGAGLDAGWLSGEGAGVEGLRTPYGALDLKMRGSRKKGLTLTLAGGARPPGGFVVPWPFPGTPGTALVNGRPTLAARDGLHLPATTANTTVFWAPMRRTVRR